MPHEGETPPLIHIGCHKTATTFLQKNLFTDKDIFSTPWGPQPALAIEHFVLLQPELFDAKRARSAFYQSIDNSELIPVISNEVLWGNPFSGRFDNGETARRLKETFPEARVLIGTREQESMLLSLYFQYVRQGGTAPIETLLQQNVGKVGFRPQWRLEYFEYDLLVSHYIRLFGKDRVLVLPIEQLKRDHEEYFARLGRFVSRALTPPDTSRVVNRRSSNVSIQIQRQINKVFPPLEDRPERYEDTPLRYRLRARSLRLLDRMTSQKGRKVETLEATISIIVGNRFRKSNERLAELTGIDLAGYGYDL